MIRVSTTAAELFAKIEDHKPGWLNDAKAAYRIALAAGRGRSETAEHLE